MEPNILQPAETRQIVKKQIIACLDNGFTLSKITKLSGYPTYSTIIGWAESDESFAKALITARTAQGHKAADQAREITDRLVEGMTDPDREIDWKALNPTLQHLRWSAERGAPQAYGQKMEVKHTGTVNVRTSFLIPRSKQSVDDGEVIDLDASMEPAALIESGDDEWMG
jgi:hypothetical protein